jgi:hypothetical protein
MVLSEVFWCEPEAKKMMMPASRYLETCSQLVFTYEIEKVISYSEVLSLVCRSGIQQIWGKSSTRDDGDHAQTILLYLERLGTGTIITNPAQPSPRNLLDVFLADEGMYFVSAVA